MAGSLFGHPSGTAGLTSWRSVAHATRPTWSLAKPKRATLWFRSCCASSRDRAFRFAAVFTLGIKPRVAGEFDHFVPFICLVLLFTKLCLFAAAGDETHRNR